jgi:hypothetical protein
LTSADIAGDGSPQAAGADCYALLSAPKSPPATAAAEHTKKNIHLHCKAVLCSQAEAVNFRSFSQLEIWEISEIWGAAFYSAGLMCGADHYVFEKAT